MLRVLTAGESHGPELIAMMEGLPSGVPISAAAIQADQLTKRVGIGGVLIMEVDQGAPVGTEPFMSNSWRELFKHTLREANRLGLEMNETGWVIGLAIECYEKGLITAKDTGGLKMTWGNVEAVKSMLHKIAHREGFGDVLAEGVMRAARRVGVTAGLPSGRPGTTSLLQIQVLQRPGS